MDHRNFGIAMRVATVTAMFALATAAEAQHSSTHKTATTANSKPIVPDGRRTGLVLGVYTIAAPGVTLTGDDVDVDPFLVIIPVLVAEWRLGSFVARHFILKTRELLLELVIAWPFPS